MSIVYGLLSVLMLLDCVFLVFLVLVQLPKKDAGAGMAFGAGATDALFGAGSGNVLTKITKYAGGIFFVLAIVMAMVASHQNKTSGGQSLMEEMGKGQQSPAAPSGLPAQAPATVPTSTNGGLLQTPLLSNLPPVQAPASTTGPTPTTTPPATNK